MVEDTLLEYIVWVTCPHCETTFDVDHLLEYCCPICGRELDESIFD